MERVKICEGCPYLRGVAGCFYIAGKITERCPRIIASYDELRKEFGGKCGKES